MSHTISISWTASVDAVEGYNVYRSASAGTETTKLNTVLVTATSFVDQSPLIGQNYYIAKSVVGGVESVASNEANAVLLPAAPTQLVATVV